jgi:hypothetical protein
MVFMKKGFLVCALAITLALMAGCLKDSSTGTSDIVATETWTGVMNNDSAANNNAITFQKKTDGSIAVSADWQFGSPVGIIHCPFTNGVVTIADSVLSVTASGTATITNVPVGYNTSPFTVSVTDTVKNWHGHGRWVILFSAGGNWPASWEGTEIITRTSGSGITN